MLHIVNKDRLICVTEVNRMKKKYKKAKHFENIVVFPGMTERLLEEGHRYAENYQYDLAVKSFDEALRYTEGDEGTLSVYAYALYEIRAFDRAKLVCEELLAMGPTLYFEVMELYLTICMQLKNFEQATTLIAALLEEEAVPPEYIEKFERLKQLNSEIAENRQTKWQVDEQEIDGQNCQFNDFKNRSIHQQITLLHELTHTNIRPLQTELVAMISDTDMHPFVQSLALLLLVEQQVDVTVTVNKLGEMRVVNPNDLRLPTELPQFQQIQTIVQTTLEKDPTTLEMVEYLIAKHAIVSYPFEWLSYDIEDIAQSYIDYVQAMFGHMKEMDYELIDFIQLLDRLSEFQHI